MLQDAEFFNAALRDHLLQSATLFLNEETFLALIMLQQNTWGRIASDASHEIVPKTGRWLGVLRLSLCKSPLIEALEDESLEWTANKTASFLGEDDGIPFVHLS